MTGSRTGAGVCGMCASLTLSTGLEVQPDLAADLRALKKKGLKDWLPDLLRTCHVEAFINPASAEVAATAARLEQQNRA